MRISGVLTFTAALLLTAVTLTAQEAPRHYDLYVHFETTMGDMTAQLYPERNPVTVENFVQLVEGKKLTFGKDMKLTHKPFFDGLEFHRVIKGFMIQTGLVKEGLPCGTPYIHDEIDSARTFATPFALAMANAGRPDSSNCQIFITVTPQRPLDGKYTIFGQLVSGHDVAEKISEVPVKKEKPVTPVIILHATIERRPR